jgi:hypothetical protein
MLAAQVSPRGDSLTVLTPFTWNRYRPDPSKPQEVTI